jgi:very-short-patch-repair endonuclease
MGTPQQQERVRALVRRQHGVVTREQLRQAGLSDKQIHRRCVNGDFARVHPGTFVACASAPTWESCLTAAVLSIEGAAAGMRSAARLHRLDGFTSGAVEVIKFGQGVRRDGVIIHRTDHLPRSHRTTVRGIATTTVARTLLDLGAVVSRDALELGVESAIRMGLASHAHLERQLDRSRGHGRRDRSVLQHVLNLRKGLKPTESVFETKLFQVLRRGGLPLPQRQIPVYEDGVFLARPDFLYPETRVAIEAVSRKHHLAPAYEVRDVDRRRRLIGAGYTVIEVTWRAMIDSPELVVDDVARALGLRLF